MLKLDYTSDLNSGRAALAQHAIRERRDRFFERALQRGADIQIPPYSEDRDL